MSLIFYDEADDVTEADLEDLGAAILRHVKEHDQGKPTIQAWALPPSATHFMDVWSHLFFRGLRNQGITAPPGWPLRHSHKRAHLNKFNRHKKRPNGRPRHR